ncbi:MAG: NADH-quinone oxidoreductase subunit J [Acidimicrobiales bacterium]
MVEVVTFVLAAAIVLGGAIGVVALRNPVHSALSLIASFFGIAVLFVAQDAHFLAAVQVIVYSGAIVVLFLFVIMLLGVDRSEDLTTDPIGGQRPAAAAVGVAILGALIGAVVLTRADTDVVVTGSGALTGELLGPGENISRLGESLFTDYVFAFEITSVLLIIAVVGAVVLARTPSAAQAAADDLIDADDLAADDTSER